MKEADTVKLLDPGMFLFISSDSLSLLFSDEDDDDDGGVYLLSGSTKHTPASNNCAEIRHVSAD